MHCDACIVVFFLHPYIPASYIYVPVENKNVDNHYKQLVAGWDRCIQN